MLKARWNEPYQSYPLTTFASAQTFYVDGLGFQVAFQASDDGHSGLLGVARGTIELTLDSPRDGHGRHACASIHVDDTDAYYREWSDKVTVLRPPKKTRRGVHGRSICSTRQAIRFS